MSEWVNAIDYARLHRQQRAMFRHQGRQIVLFVADGRVFACDNRCPHEGYPLREGSLDAGGCVLTCNWHNWKFDLNDGRNLYGGDRLRVYPAEVRHDSVWVDVSDPPFAQRRARMLDNLRAAFDDNAYDRMARELGRLGLLGADPLDGLREAIHWSFDRLEFGWTHAYAGSADWLTLYDQHDDPELRLICLLESLGHIADDTLRERSYPYTQTRQPYSDAALLAAIDSEDETRAIGLVNDALAQGLHFGDMEGVLSRAALAHYADFGHSLIYVNKAGRLIDRLGESVERPLLLSLVRSLVYAFREDLIPEFRDYRSALDAWQNEPPGDVPGADDYRPLSTAQALAFTAAHGGAPAEELHRALCASNADRLLHYDLSYQEATDNPVSDNVGWLSFTHGITFAGAVREQCEKFPALWPAGLLQLACFSGRNRPYADDALDTTRWRIDDREAFFRQALDTLFDHGRDEYIVSVHVLKTLLAARSEIDVGYLDDAASATLCAAINRFLHSPLKRKHVRRTARQALGFVAKDFS